MVVFCFKKMKKSIIQLILRLALAIIGIVGIIVTYSSGSFMGDNKTFLYFTVQSNVTIIAVELVFAIYALQQILGKQVAIKNWVYLVKYVFTVAITITFLVFAFMLAPTLGVDYLLSYGNFSLHFIVPILALVDFFVFGNEIKLTKVNCILGAAMPIYYVIFFLIGIPLGFTYLNGNRAPYFFLDYEKLTWFRFTENGPGVIYWILILTALIIGLCYLFLLFMKLRQKKTA